jgi:hypothetical protein
MAYRATFISDRSQGLRALLRPFDQLIRYPLSRLNLENSPHLSSKQVQKSNVFRR